MRALAATVGLGLTLSVGLPQQAFAQAAQREPGVRYATRLGGSTRFTAPVRSVDAMRRSFSRMNIQNDVGTVLNEAGLGQLRAEVLRNITEGTVTQVSIAPGTRIEWMALRQRGPRIIRTIEWAGRRPFRAFQFQIDDRQNLYTFIVPEDCGNLSVLRRGPSPIAAREAEAAAAAKARAAADAAAAAAAKAAADKAAADKAAADKAAAAKAAADKAAADAAAAAAKAAADAAAAAKAAADAAAAQAAAELREAAVRPFFGVYFGKQQRQYDATDPADLGADVNPVRRYGDTLVGGKFGVALRLGQSKWSYNPAIGFAGNLGEGSRSSFLADNEIAYNFAKGGYIGSGLSLWDFTHKDITTFSWLGSAGIPLWKSVPKGQQMDFSLEWRQFFDRGSDPDTNYMFWGGLRYMFR